MSFFDYILWPVKWVIEAILVGWHSLFTTIGLDGSTGLSWVLAITGLVVVIKGLMVPLYIQQVKAQRRLVAVGPEIRKIRADYKDKLSTFDRDEMSRKILEAYKTQGVNPAASFLPVLIQIPVLVSLFYVLKNAAQTQKEGVGLFTKNLTDQFYNSTFFNGSLHETLLQGLNNGFTATATVAIAILIIMVIVQFVTLLLDAASAKTAQQSAETSEEQKAPSQSTRLRNIMFVILTLSIIISGLFLPVALMVYLALSTVWTLFQKVITNRLLKKDVEEENSTVVAE